MGFTLATNVAALNAHTSASMTQKELSSSLEKLSSGYKLNKAADDASGMAIANSLRTQAASLGQAIRNANDAIGIIQIADKAMDEQIKILDTIKIKAVQSAQDGQTLSSRSALQADITRLMQELDNIAGTTTFNGKSLLAGGFSNANFQIGAYSNQTIRASIGATSSNKIGQTRFETGQNIVSAGPVILKFKAVNGIDDITLESVDIGHKIGTGLGVLAEAINKNSNELQVRASWNVLSAGAKTVGTDIAKGTSVKGLEINGIKLGDINDILPNDSDGKLSAAINNITAQTGINASIDARGRLQLSSLDGRGIFVKAEENFEILGLESTKTVGGASHYNYGRLTLIRNDARDIIVKQVSTTGTEEPANKIGFGEIAGKKSAETTMNLVAIRGTFTKDQASAMGAHSSKQSLLYEQTEKSGSLSTGVTTFRGAQAVMDITDTAIINLNKIRSDLGSVQIQLEATVNNISTTKVNVQFSESQIRDTDFATETSNFKRNNILAQAGSYALAQSSTVQQNIQRLLQ